MILLLLAIALAGPEDAVRKHLAAGDPDKALARCEKSGADLPGAAPELRDLCARAAWPAAEATDTSAGWAAYGAKWAGTRGQQPAFEREAVAALREMGQGTEASLKRHTERYAGTAAAEEARARLGTALAAGARTVDDVARLLRDHPTADGLDRLAAAHFAALVVVSTDGDRITATLRDGLKLPGEAPIVAAWVSRDRDGDLSPWDDAAARQLVEQGLDPEFVLAWRLGRTGRAFPLCWDPQGGLSQAAGVLVSWGGAELFVDHDLDPRCGKTAWPSWVLFDGAAVSGLSLAPGHFLPLATGKGDKGFSWNGTTLWLPGAPMHAFVLKDAVVIGQRVGSMFLVHPLSGGMPWVTAEPPPADSLRLTSGLAVLSPPPGWALSTGARGSIVEGPGMIGVPDGVWTLPRGEARPLSPLAQEVTGLGRHNPKLLPAGAPPLEKAAWRTRGSSFVADAPAGAVTVPLPELDRAGLLAGVSTLTSAGVVIVPLRGWRLDLDDDPTEELVIEGTIEGFDVRVIVDTYPSGATRTFVFDAVPAGTRDTATVFAFTRDAVAYVAFVGREGGLSTAEALHFDARGLIREVSRL